MKEWRGSAGARAVEKAHCVVWWSAPGCGLCQAFCGGAPVVCLGDQEQPCRSRGDPVPWKETGEGAEMGRNSGWVVTERSVRPVQWERECVEGAVGLVTQQCDKTEGTSMACRRDAGICLCSGCMWRTDGGAGGDTQRPEEAVAYFGLRVGT